MLIKNCVDGHADMKGMTTMPRIKGSRNKAKALTINEQITATAARVEKLKAELLSAEEELRNLTALRDEQAMKELLATMAGKGISVADVVALIKSRS